MSAQTAHLCRQHQSIRITLHVLSSANHEVVVVAACGLRLRLAVREERGPREVQVRSLDFVNLSCRHTARPDRRVVRGVRGQVVVP